MKIDFHKELKANIDALYNVFKNYSVDSDINFEQEYGDEIKKRLIGSELKDICMDDIRDYLGNPKEKSYKRNEVKYFLPRIIELFIKGEKITVIENDVFKILIDIDFWSEGEEDELSKLANKYFSLFVVNKYYLNVVNVFKIFRFKVFKSDHFFKAWKAMNNVKSLISYLYMLSENQYFDLKNKDEVMIKVESWAKDSNTKKHFENIIYTEYMMNMNEYDINIQRNIDYLVYYFIDNS